MSISPATMPRRGSLFPSFPGSTPVAMNRVVEWLYGPACRLHGMIRELAGFGGVEHAALSVYDPATDMLWNFACRASGPERPEVAEVEMTDVPSLVMLADEQSPRIIHDVARLGEDGRNQPAGCRAMMTVPLRLDGGFLGFVSFGAAQPGFFRPEVTETMLTFAEAYAILIGRARSLPE